MKLERVAVAAAAEGDILVHTHRLMAMTIKKGRVLTRADLDALLQARIEYIHVARLESGDIGEDLAAERVATALAGAWIAAGMPANGRCNLFAGRAGVLRYDAALLARANAAVPELNIIALPPAAAVARNQHVAQVKLIPYGIGATSIAQLLREMGAGALFDVSPFMVSDCGLLQTMLPGARSSVLDKTRAVLAGKLAQWNARIISEQNVAHDLQAIGAAIDMLESAGCRMILVSGACATMDVRDVVPAAVLARGGRIVQLGVPVDPGTLLGLAYTATGTPLFILPGSQRSPVPSSFDLLAPRALAGDVLSAAELRALGAGGLLKSSASIKDANNTSNGSPAPRIAAIVLAAGRSRRMGMHNKLLAEVDGKPMVRRVVDMLLATRIAQIIVVTGHEAGDVRSLLDPHLLTMVDNPEFANGVSTSLRAGLQAVFADIDAALVCLADMPWLTGDDVNRIIDAAGPAPAERICVPMHEGRQGNPVMWGRAYFPALELLTGDQGAKKLLAAYADGITPVELSSIGILRDVDTPEDLA